MIGFIKRNFDSNLIGLILVGVLSLTMLVVVWPSPFVALPIILLGTALGCFIAVVIHRDHLEQIQEESDQTLAARLNLATKSPSYPMSGVMAQLQASQPALSTAAFCGDCGKKYTTWSRQDGFNPDTGDPHMLKFNACPDWSNERIAIPSFLARTSGDPFFCGNRKVTEPSSKSHVTHAVGDVIGDCPGCLEQMIADGIITRAQAEQRTA